MKKSLSMLFVAAATVLMITATQVRADELTANEILLRGSNGYVGTVTAKFDDGETSKSNGGGFGRYMTWGVEHTPGIWGDYSRVGDKFQTFCGDVFTEWSTEFGSGKDADGEWASQKFEFYNLKDVPSSFYTDQQKVWLQSLYDHTYSYAYDEAGNQLNKYIAAAVQFATWEIIHETNGILDVFEGNFTMTSNKGLQKTALELANAMLQFLNDGVTGDWSGIVTTIYENEYYDSSTKKTIKPIEEEDHAWGTFKPGSTEITVYFAENNETQTMIQVTTITRGQDNVTPEPATLLILGVAGLAGIPALRKRIKK